MPSGRGGTSRDSKAAPVKTGSIAKTRPRDIKSVLLELICTVHQPCNRALQCSPASICNVMGWPENFISRQKFWVSLFSL